MTDLSPAAQAVLDAYETAPLHRNWHMANRLGLAAALRAAADQVVPDKRSDGVYLQGDDYQRWHERKMIRRQFLVIVTELEGKQ